MDKKQPEKTLYQENHVENSASQEEMEELKNRVRETWGKLSDDEIEHCEDQRDRFLKAVEQQYGIPREKADKTLRDIERQCGIAA